VDLKNGKLAGSIEVEGLNPAGLVLDPRSPRMFVVMGDTSQVVVIDREKRKVIAMWPITGGRSLMPWTWMRPITGCLSAAG